MSGKRSYPRHSSLTRRLISDYALEKVIRRTVSDMLSRKRQKKLKYAQKSVEESVVEERPKAEPDHMQEFTHKGTQKKGWGLMQIQHIDPADKCYSLEGHAAEILDSNLLTMTERIRLELTIRLQQVQARVTKALANVGMEANPKVLPTIAIPPPESRSKKAEWEARLVLSNQLREKAGEAAERLKLLEQVSQWLEQLCTDLDQSGGICAPPTLKAERIDVDDIKTAEESVMPTVYAVGKLQRLCQRVMKEAGIIGWREQLVTKKPPTIVGEEAISADFNKSSKAAFLVLKKSINEISQMSHNPVIKMWIKQVKHQLQALYNGTAKTTQEFSQIAKGIKDRKLMMQIHARQLHAAQQNTARVERELNNVEQAYTSLKSAQEVCAKQVKNMSEKNRILEGFIAEMRGHMDILEKGKLGKKPLKQLRVALDEMERTRAATSIVSEAPDMRRSSVGDDAVAVKSVNEVETQAGDGSTLIPEGYVLTEVSKISQLNKALQWKAKAMDAFKNRLQKEKGSGGVKIFETVMRDLKEEPVKEQKEVPLERVSSLKNQLALVSEDFKFCQARLKLSCTEVDHLRSMLAKRDSDLKDLHRYIRERFGGSFSRSSTSISHSTRLSHIYEVLGMVEKLLQEVVKLSSTPSHHGRPMGSASDIQTDSRHRNVRTPKMSKKSDIDVGIEYRSPFASDLDITQKKKTKGKAKRKSIDKNRTKDSMHDQTSAVSSQSDIAKLDIVRELATPSSTSPLAIRHSWQNKLADLISSLKRTAKELPPQAVLPNRSSEFAKAAGVLSKDNFNRHSSNVFRTQHSSYKQSHITISPNSQPASTLNVQPFDRSSRSSDVISVEHFHHPELPSTAERLSSNVSFTTLDGAEQQGLVSDSKQAAVKSLVTDEHGHKLSMFQRFKYPTKSTATIAGVSQVPSAVGLTSVPQVTTAAVPATQATGQATLFNVPTRMNTTQLSGTTTTPSPHKLTETSQTQRVVAPPYTSGVPAMSYVGGQANTIGGPALVDATYIPSVATTSHLYEETTPSQGPEMILFPATPRQSLTPSDHAVTSLLSSSAVVSHVSNSFTTSMAATPPTALSMQNPSPSTLQYRVNLAAVEPTTTDTVPLASVSLTTSATPSLLTTPAPTSSLKITGSGTASAIPTYSSATIVPPPITNVTRLENPKPLSAPEHLSYVSNSKGHLPGQVSVNNYSAVTLEPAGTENIIPTFVSPTITEQTAAQIMRNSDQPEAVTRLQPQTGSTSGVMHGTVSPGTSTALPASSQLPSQNMMTLPIEPVTTPRKKLEHGTSAMSRTVQKVDSSLTQLLETTKSKNLQKATKIVLKEINQGSPKESFVPPTSTTQEPWANSLNLPAQTTSKNMSNVLTGKLSEKPVVVGQPIILKSSAEHRRKIRQEEEHSYWKKRYGGKTLVKSLKGTTSALVRGSKQTLAPTPKRLAHSTESRLGSRQLIAAEKRLSLNILRSFSEQKLPRTQTQTRPRGSKSAHEILTHFIIPDHLPKLVNTAEPSDDEDVNFLTDSLSHSSPNFDSTQHQQTSANEAISQRADMPPDCIQQSPVVSSLLTQHLQASPKSQTTSVAVQLPGNFYSPPQSEIGVQTSPLSGREKQDHVVHKTVSTNPSPIASSIELLHNHDTVMDLPGNTSVVQAEISVLGHAHQTPVTEMSSTQVDRNSHDAKHGLQPRQLQMSRPIPDSMMPTQRVVSVYTQVEQGQKVERSKDVHLYADPIERYEVGLQADEVEEGITQNVSSCRSAPVESSTHLSSKQYTQFTSVTGLSGSPGNSRESQQFKSSGVNETDPDSNTAASAGVQVDRKMKSVMTQGSDVDREREHTGLLRQYRVLKADVTEAQDNIKRIIENLNRALQTRSAAVSDADELRGKLKSLYNTHEHLVHQMELQTFVCKVTSPPTTRAQAMPSLGTKAPLLPRIPKQAGRGRVGDVRNKKEVVPIELDLPDKQTALDVDAALGQQLKVIHSNREDIARLVGGLSLLHFHLDQRLDNINMKMKMLKHSGKGVDVGFSPQPARHRQWVSSLGAGTLSTTRPVAMHKQPLKLDYPNPPSPESAVQITQKDGDKRLRDPPNHRIVGKNITQRERNWLPKSFTPPYWRSSHPVDQLYFDHQTLKEASFLTETRIMEAEVKSLQRPFERKGPKHQMRLETVKGYCIDKYNASLPLTVTSPSKSGSYTNDSPYSCLKHKERQKHTKEVNCVFPHIHFID